jgi:hypothetical protein
MYRSVVLMLSVGIALMSTTTNAEGPAFPQRFPWGRIVVAGMAVELHVTTFPENGVVAVPRFNSPYQRIYLKSDPKKTALDFGAGVKEWLVTLPPSPNDAAIVVIETVGKPQLLTKPFVIEATPEGTYLLPAHFAVVHGEKLRYEPQPHKNTVGYWHNENDWCEWKLKIPQPGKYDVYVQQGCGKGHGGSEVEVKIGESRLAFTVEDTGHFQNFKERQVGTLKIAKANEGSLQLRPISKASVAVMDVRRIRLVPVP